MKIQINTDKNFAGSDDLIASSTSLVSEELSLFSQQITRVEVHFSDEDGQKEGIDDKRCMVEARLAGLHPIAVTNHANTYEQAVFGALVKMQTALKKTTGRLKDH